MKIALIGYGKMGAAIEEIAAEKGHEVVLRARSDWDGSGLAGADVAIEFTRPEAAVENLYRCFRAGVPVVCGTTGWLKDWDAVTGRCASQNGGLLQASNFSLGVNLYFHFLRLMGRVMNAYPEYEASVEEVHHIHKKDAPSGTALEMVRILSEEISRYHGWTMANQPKPGHLPVNAIREDEVPGTHSLTFTGGVDELVFTHRAYSRKGFAAGAVMAAEWMAGKTGVYHFQDLLKL